MEEKGINSSTERAQVGWGTWLAWLLSSTVGLAVGGALGGVVGVAVFFTTGLVMGGPLALFFMGIAGSVAVGVAIVGIAQGFILRRQISAGWWVLASMVGLAVSLALVFTVVFALNMGAVGAVVGASVGIAQWLVLRRRVYRASWWVLANTVGVAVGGALGVAVGGAVVASAGGGVGEVEALAVGIAMAIAMGGIWYGAFTGSVMVWLLRRSSEKELVSRQAAE
jgi:hypothetical protein